MNARKLRVERDGFLEFFDRLWQETGLAISAPDQHAQRGTITKSIDHAFKGLSRLRNVFAFQITKTKRVFSVVVVGRQPQCFLKFTGGFFKVTHHEVGLAEQMMRDRILRIGRDYALQRLEAFLVFAGMKVSDGEIDQSFT